MNFTVHKGVRLNNPKFTFIFSYQVFIGMLDLNLVKVGSIFFGVGVINSQGPRGE